MNEILNFLTSAHVIVLFMVLTGYLALGDFLTKKTKALIPSIFVFALLLGVTSWTGLIPPNIAELTGVFGPMGALMMILIVLNMGTTLDIKDITSNWKVAIIGLVALGGVAIACLTIGASIWGWDKAVVATPVVGGGIVAALEMQGAALKLGNEELASLAVLVLTLQSFPAFIIIPPLLKSAWKKDVKNVSKEEFNNWVNKEENNDSEQRKTIIPESYLTPATILFLLSIIGSLAWLSSKLTETFMGSFAISASIFALLYAILATSFGFLPKNATAKAGASGVIFIFVIISAFSSIATSDFNSIVQLLLPLVGMIFVGIIGILISTVLVGKFFFKYDWKVSFVLGLNCLLGFPLNYSILMETLDAFTTDEDEKKYIYNKYMPMMLVAGFVTITIGSVVLAGIMKGFLH